MPDEVEVTDNKSESRFETTIEGHTAFVDYRRTPGRLVLTHTEVPPELGGRGLAGKLVRSVLDTARAAHLRVVPLCEYVRSYIEKHPEYQDLLAGGE